MSMTGFDEENDTAPVRGHTLVTAMNVAAVLLPGELEIMDTKDALWNSLRDNERAAILRLVTEWFGVRRNNSIARNP